MSVTVEKLCNNITRNSPLALYYQLKQSIVGCIQRGSLKPGDRLPAEREAARASGLSRMTVRQAYNELLAEGVLTRKPGRGTFVAQGKDPYGIGMAGGFTEESIRRGLDPETTLLGVEVVPSTDEVAAQLALQPGEDVYRIRRVHSIRKRTVDLAVCYVSRREFPGLEKIRNLSSLYQVFSSRYNVSVVRATESIEPVKADAETAGVLDVPVGSLILYMKRVSYSDDNQPVEYVELFLNSRNYKFVMEVRRQPGVDHAVS